MVRPVTVGLSASAYARGAVRQVLTLTPVFWLLELSQNQLFRLVWGEWGWLYPASRHRWFSFGSLVLWACAVWLLWTLHACWFQPRRLGLGRRVAYGALILWGGEWLGGFLADQVFGTPLHVWPDSPLVYVSFGALPLWVGNVALYHLLILRTVDLTPDAPAR